MKWRELIMRYENDRNELIKIALEMKANGLIKMSGGNVSKRVSDKEILVTPTAMDYETMKPEDICVVDYEGNVVDGIRKPTSDLKAILYIFKHMPWVNVIIHTHQPNATAVSLVCNQLPCVCTTMVDELHGPVNVAPFTISSDEGMGISTVKYAGDSLAVILKHHGVISYGKNSDQALCAAIYLEETAEVYLKALATGKKVEQLTEEEVALEDAPRGNYGQ